MLFRSVFGYEAAQVLFAALSRSEDRKNLKEAILSIRTFKGLQGNIVIDQYGDPERVRFLSVIRDGKFITAEQ